MSDVPQGSPLGSVPFNILINDINSRTECTFSKLGDDIKLLQLVGMRERMPSGGTLTGLRIGLMQMFEVQYGQVQGPASGSRQPPLSVQAWA